MSDGKGKNEEEVMMETWTVVFQVGRGAEGKGWEGKGKEGEGSR